MAEINRYGSYHYETLMRLSQQSATLKCNGTIMNKYNDNTDIFVGALTADEAVYAGTALNYTSGSKSYLVNNYQKDKLGSFWTLSPCNLQGDRESAYAVYSS